MSATGKDLNPEQAKLMTEALHYLKDREGILAFITDHHPAGLAGVTGDGFIDFDITFIRRLAINDSVVYLINLPFLKLAVEFLMCLRCTGIDDGTARWLVQPMYGDDGIAEFTAEQSRQIRDIRIIAIRDREEVSGLIDDDDVLVVEENFELQREMFFFAEGKGSVPCFTSR